MKQETNIINYTDYSKHYDESRFWATLHKAMKAIGRKIAYPALILYYEMRSPEVPIGVKLEIMGALGYLILPFDLIPDFIPVVGYTDDLAALLAMVRLTREYITPDIEAQAEQKLDEWFGSDKENSRAAA